MSLPIRLQPLTRARVARLGEAGATWLAALPGVLADLERGWSITVGRSLPGGSASYVARARTADGTDVVLKVAVSSTGLDGQAATLRRAEGRGYARLIAYDPARHALLLEALGPSVEHSGWSPEDQLARLADTLALAWQDAPGPVDPAQDKASGLHRLITDLWPRLDRPCSAAVIEQALEFAERRQVVDADELVVVHGDPHPANLLAVRHPRPGAETGYCFVDPDGFVADRAYDLGVVLRDWTSTLVRSDHPRRTAERYAHLLARRSGVDATRIWEWGFMERVSTGLYVLATVGSPAVGRPFLETAELLLD